MMNEDCYPQPLEPSAATELSNVDRAMLLRGLLPILETVGHRSVVQEKTFLFQVLLTALESLLDDVDVEFHTRRVRPQDWLVCKITIEYAANDPHDTVQGLALILQNPRFETSDK